MEGLEGLERVLLGILFSLAVAGIIDLSKMGCFSKKKRRSYVNTKRMNNLKEDIKKLKGLFENNVLSKDEFELKTNNIQNEIERIEVDFLLLNEEKYKNLIIAYKEKLLNEVELEKKLDDLKKELYTKHFSKKNI